MFCYVRSKFTNYKVFMSLKIAFTKTLLKCHILLMIFANSLDPDQASQDTGPDLDPNCLKLLRYYRMNVLNI